MLINTTRFGEIEVKEENYLKFPQGIPGFTGVHRFTMINLQEESPFAFLQCLDDPDLTFVVTEPRKFFSEYKVNFSEEELTDIELASVEEAIVLVILTVPEEVDKMTANLKGPIIINPEQRLAKQLILSTDAYNTRHSLFPDKIRDAG